MKFLNLVLHSKIYGDSLQHRNVRLSWEEEEEARNLGYEVEDQSFEDEDGRWIEMGSTITDLEGRFYVTVWSNMPGEDWINRMH